MAHETSPQFNQARRAELKSGMQLPKAMDASAAGRQLGSLEHLLWLQDQHRSVHFALTALISGRTTPSDLRTALDRVQGRHPLLSVRITKEATPKFVKITNAPIPLRVVEGNPGLDWQREVAEELANPFDPNRAPLLRAVLIYAPQNAALILVAHHSIADGLSIAYVIRDLLLTLNGIRLDPLPLPPSQDTLISKNFPSTGEPIEERAPVGSPAIYLPQEDAKPTVRGLQLSSELTSALRTRARKEGTSVHGALCAALVIFHRAQSVTEPQTPVRIMSPIETRTTLDLGSNCGLFVATVISSFDQNDVGFWHLARKVKDDVGKAKRPESMAAAVSALQKNVPDRPDVAAVAQLFSVGFAHEGIVTNLGALPFESRIGELELTAFFGPAASTHIQGANTIGVATIDGGICLTHTGHGAEEGLLEAMRQTLEDALSIPTPDNAGTA
jgi:NRPS condensation-like uncharacterized protein